MQIEQLRVPLSDGVFTSSPVAKFLTGGYDEDTDSIALTVLVDGESEVEYKLNVYRSGDQVDEDAIYLGSFFEEVYQDFVHIFIIQLGSNANT